jgi:hypothetical protein
MQEPPRVTASGIRLDSVAFDAFKPERGTMWRRVAQANLTVGSYHKTTATMEAKVLIDSLTTPFGVVVTALALR